MSFEEWLARNGDLVARQEPCPMCEGTGKIECGSCLGEGECPHCGQTCGECDGAGELSCEECGGTGKVPDPKTLYEEQKRLDLARWEIYAKSARQASMPAGDIPRS